jgi:tetratricopeptide (TPR) repeat protein
MQFRIRAGRLAPDDFVAVSMRVLASASHPGRIFLKPVYLAASFILLLSLFPPVTLHAQTTSSAALIENRSPEELQSTAAAYEKFLREPPAGTQRSKLVEVETHLGAVYFLLHRYRDSLDALERIPHGSSASHESDPANANPAIAANLRAEIDLVSGLDYLELNQLPQSISSLRHALQLQPNNATARLALGDAYARSDQLRSAVDEYQQQLQRTPLLPDAWYKLGLAHSFIAVQPFPDSVKKSQSTVLSQFEAERLLDQGHYLDSAHMLFKLVRDAPDHPGLHADLGRALLHMGYAKAAEEQLRKELAIDPANPTAHVDLAQTAALRGDWQQVSEQLTRVSAAQPRELTRLLEMRPADLVVQAWTQGAMRPPDSFAGTSVGGLWRAWMDESQLVQIKTDASVSCAEIPPAALAPGMWLSESCEQKLLDRLGSAKAVSPGQKIKLAETQFRLAQYDLSLRTASALLASDPTNEWAAYWFRNSHRALAEQCFLKVADLDPDSARAHQMLAQDYAAWLQFARAKKEYQAAIALAPSQADLHLGLGTVDWQSKDWPEAEKELKLALELAPESALARYELGDTYIQQGHWQEAFTELTKIPSNSSVSYESTLDLAKAQDELGHGSDAIHTLLTIVSRDHDGQAYFLLASLYRKSGDAARAQDALQTFKRLRAASLQSGQEEIGALEDEQAVNAK